MERCENFQSIIRVNWHRNLRVQIGKVGTGDKCNLNILGPLVCANAAPSFHFASSFSYAQNLGSWHRGRVRIQCFRTTRLRHRSPFFLRFFLHNDAHQIDEVMILPDNVPIDIKYDQQAYTIKCRFTGLALCFVSINADGQDT